ncbi:MAG TPA: LytTR family transcriptional regulator DNA-binding domain-containing protein [Bacteroidia bacterium]|nr:LytTR family transcriptional regulator DNA-binding domain-containing protein [Bacteroidia bacterium]
MKKLLFLLSITLCLNVQAQLCLDTTIGTGAKPLSVASADFNNDGYTDLVTTVDNPNGNVYILFGTATGKFIADTTYILNNNISYVISNDFNKDGNADLIVNSQNETVYLDVKNITRLESDSNYTYIILTDGKKITSTKILKDYESVLNPDTFFRVHKTVIVNINHIQKFVKSDGGYIIMNDDIKVPVSREKRQDLLTILANI